MFSSLITTTLIILVAPTTKTQTYDYTNGQQSQNPYTHYTSNQYSYSKIYPNPFIYPIPSPRYKSYHFTLTEGLCNPDNFIQPCYLINNQSPGPPIFVNQFDFLEVIVVNKLSVPTTIHFHGILQTHTLSSDGAPFVTQDPIQPNQTYIYQINIEGQTGTYMYHGHFDLDLNWLHGPLIIRDNPVHYAALGPPYQYDEGHEHIFQLESVTHPPVPEIIASLPINGNSYGIWPNSLNSKLTSYKSQYRSPGYEVVSVTPGKTYRFRIINISTGSMFRFEIENHNLVVIETDGILIEPVVTSHLEINTGQRYSVLVTMNKTINNYWISSVVMAGINVGGPANGKAILHYKGSIDPTPLRRKLFLESTRGLEATFNGWILPEIRPNQNYIGNLVYPFPPKSNHTILIDIRFKMVGGAPKFLINDNVYQDPDVTYLTSVREGKDISVGDTHVFKFMEGDVVDMVFQNRVDGFGVCEEHPIHLHGHSFWVVASGNNTIEMEEEYPRVLEEAEKKGDWREFRDVFTIFPGMEPKSNITGDPCGWSIIRFRADNPGIWLVHCHITEHILFGLQFVMYELERENPRLIGE